ncbi:MAG: 50S ribosomal protein L11 [Candidatus Brockarchaeota archaeon]|nr:50S ribosomal protein L11 [Candidatus Brockarchaeota archaeon]
MPEKSVKVIVSGGEASPAPPLGPTLGPLGVNVGAVVSEINRLTGEFKGMKVPVTVTVDSATKNFSVKVGIPTTAALIVREAKAEKGSGKPNLAKVGDITFAQVMNVALVKKGSSYAHTLKSAVKEVLGSCVSLGVTVEGEDPREVCRKLDQGAYDEALRAKDGRQQAAKAGEA